ncbi:MAG: SpoIIE family protein phosphatase [Alphaproteobacteria bacterium]
MVDDGGFDGGLEHAGYLALIAEMNREFHVSQDLAATARRGLVRIAQHLRAEAASLFLLEPDGRTLVCQACHGPVDITGLRIGSSQGIVGRAVQTNSAQLVADVHTDPDFHGQVDARTGFVTRSILTAPVSVGVEPLGAIQVINRERGGLFDHRDRVFLEVLAESAALAIVNARLTSAMVEQQKYNRELELAAEIQRGLLPVFDRDPYPIFALNLPARRVSGDFFDVVETPDGRLWFNIGDVSGKGMNAALLMAKTTSLFRCLAKTAERPGHLLDLINRELCETGTNGMFVTLVGGFLEPSSGRVCLANAGHEPPLLLDREGRTFSDFPALAPPVGISEDLMGGEGFPETTISLHGGCLYIFTDGLTEAYTSGEGTGMLGVEGVKELIRRHRRSTLRARLAAIAAEAVPPATALRDDLTLLAIEVTVP